MAKTLHTAQLLCNEFLRCLVDWLKLDDMEGRVIVGADGPAFGWKLGATVHVRVSDTRAWSTFPLNTTMIDTRTPVNLVYSPAFLFECLPEDLVLNIDQLSDRCIRPAAYELSAKVLSLWPAGSTMVVAPHYVPMGVYGMECVRSTDGDSGLSVRLFRYYDTALDVWRLKFEMLFGILGQAAAVPVFVYRPTPAEIEVIGLLLEARAQYLLQLEELRLAA